MKRAFSLSEVLITIGVIGVVATMTIFVIKAQVQWLILKNQYKKVYSMYSQALQAVQSDNELYPYVCYLNENNIFFNSECNLLYSELYKKLKIIKTCDSNALANGCIPKYYSYSDVSSCSGFNENSINNHNKVVVLNDSSILIHYSSLAPFFAIDINGFKGPNKAGYDLFLFTFRMKKNGLYLEPLYGGCQWLAPGGKYGKEMLK